MFIHLDIGTVVEHVKGTIDIDFQRRCDILCLRFILFSMQNRELIYPCLSKGYADAIAAHETAILQCMSDYKLDYRILEEPLLTVGLGVAFSKQDDRGLEQKLSETFEEMRADGTMEEIIGRYLEENDMGVIADVE